MTATRAQQTAATRLTQLAAEAETLVAQLGTAGGDSNFYVMLDLVSRLGERAEDARQRVISREQLVRELEAK